jgi:IclR family pca regulon transcriptional regulator
MKKKPTKRGKAGESPERPVFSKGLEKGLLILGLFSPEAPKLSLTDIALTKGLNPTPAYRLVETLIQLGYLDRDPKTKLVRLGPMAMILSVNISRGFDLLRVVKPLIDEAHQRLNVHIDLAAGDPYLPTVIYRREAKDTLVFNLPIHAPDALHSTALGKALLSALPDETLKRVLDGYVLTRRTPHTITTRAALLADLAQTRRRGYSVNNEELVLGQISVGAPLVNREGNVLGAISFDVARVHYTVEEVEKRFAPALLRLVRDISPMLPL